MTDAIDASLSFEISKLQINSIRDSKKRIGYSVIHKFRYKDFSGNSTIRYYYFLFDKGLDNILCSIDLNNETNQAMIEVLKQYCSSNE